MKIKIVYPYKKTKKRICIKCGKKWTEKRYDWDDGITKLDNGRKPEMCISCLSAHYK